MSVKKKALVIVNDPVTWHATGQGLLAMAIENESMSPGQRRFRWPSNSAGPRR